MTSRQKGVIKMRFSPMSCVSLWNWLWVGFIGLEVLMCKVTGNTENVTFCRTIHAIYMHTQASNTASQGKHYVISVSATQKSTKRKEKEEKREGKMEFSMSKLEMFQFTKKQNFDIRTVIFFSFFSTLRAFSALPCVSWLYSTLQRAITTQVEIKKIR